MDFAAMYQELNERFQDFLRVAKQYFLTLSQMEMYAWGVFALGFVILIAGFVVWL